MHWIEARQILVESLTYVNDFHSGGQAEADSVALDESRFSLVVSDHVLRCSMRTKFQKSL